VTYNKKEVGNCDYKIDLGNGNEIVSKPQNVSHRLNFFFFVDSVDSLLNQYNNPTINSTPKHSTSVSSSAPHDNTSLNTLVRISTTVPCSQHSLVQ